MEAVTFVTVVNDFGELDPNLMASPVVHSAAHELLIIDSVGNTASEHICRCIIRGWNAPRTIFFSVHQDVFIPAALESQLAGALAELNSVDPNWGVIGAVGVLPSTAGHAVRGNWADPGNSGSPVYRGPLPSEVGSVSV